MRQCFCGNLEGERFIVTCQNLNVLQQERRRSPGFQDARDIEEQSALRFVQKYVFAAERVLLGNTRDRERLTWEAGEQDVVIRNLIGVDRRDIAMWRMIVAEVGRIGLLRELVPLRGEHAVSPDRFEAFANAAHASDKVAAVEPSCSLFRGS